MQVKSIKVTQLFGNFDHVVNFHTDERISIITAPNGYGKTILLKILDSVINKKLTFIESLEFEEIRIGFDNNVVSISKIYGDSEEDVDGVKLTLNDSEEDFFTFSRKIFNKHKKSIPVNEIEFRVHHLERFGPAEWIDNVHGDVLEISDIIDRYPEIFFDTEFKFEDIYPKWYLDLTSSIHSHFVQDQRLILRSAIQNNRYRTRSSINTIDAIEKYSSELSAKISESNADYSEISKSLDGSLPTRLLSKNIDIKLFAEDELKEKLEDLRTKNERLNKHNLLTTDFNVISEIETIDEEDIRILSLYVEDNNKKLSAYDDILLRIELFTDILNSKGLAFKSVEIDPKQGFIFKNKNGKELKLTQLSSGEQHEVVLLYELIFKAKDNDLVLIDEPEISLHIAWQKDFLSDLKRIIDLQNVMVVIATHSPQIIDNNWHLTIDLEDE